MSSKRHRRREAVWLKDKGLCWLCRLPVTLEAMTLDHEVPRSKGGSGSVANLRAAHFACNNARGNGDPQPARTRAPRSSVSKHKRVRGPVMHHITNASVLSTDERIAIQKREES